jgi:diguanylate cyclase (GGDEF)-like protein
MASGWVWKPILMLSIKNLPLWAKSLVAPAVVLLAMFAMAGTAFVNLANQNADIANLDSVAFEGLRQAMAATEAVTDFQTELYHLSSTAANESDHSKVEAAAKRLATRLDAIAPQIKAVAVREGVSAIAQTFAGYDWAARQMIEFTRLDAAYGVMMMGFAEDTFVQLRRVLTEASARAQAQRSEASADLLDGLARMRITFVLLVSAGVGVSVAAALLIARAISGPTVRLTRTMAALARGSVEVEIPDRQRRDEIGAMANAVEVFKQNMVKGRRLASKIEHLAHHDALTDLPNRVLFHEKLEQALRYARRGRLLALHFLDLDQFKAVNDTLGHHIGDRLLQVVAERLLDGLRETDAVARLGGDEFAILQTAIESPLDAIGFAERVIKMFAQPFEVGEHQIVVGVSIGIAFAPQDGLEADQLLKCADLALYRSKSDGRGIFRLFHAEMDARMQARRVLELDLHQALQGEQFEVFYQPLIDVRTREVTGFEALLRWRHPVRGLVSPDQFIPLAEETGMIVPIGEWVLRQACAAAANWPRGLKVAVNLSAAQFKSQGLVAATVAALRESDLPADRLELEITETVMLHDTEAILATLHQFRELGIQIAMDDFGTGYSSLSYLRRFPFDRIKIDQSFVRDLGKQPDCMAIVRAVAALGGDLGMAITAEGVETRQQLDTLERAGCTEIQGYLFSRPVPGSQVMDLLRTMSNTEDVVPLFGERAVPPRLIETADGQLAL